MSESDAKMVRCEQCGAEMSLAELESKIPNAVDMRSTPSQEGPLVGELSHLNESDEVCGPLRMVRSAIA